MNSSACCGYWVLGLSVWNCARACESVPTLPALPATGKSVTGSHGFRFPDTYQILTTLPLSFLPVVALAFGQTLMGSCPLHWTGQLPRCSPCPHIKTSPSTLQPITSLQHDGLKYKPYLSIPSSGFPQLKIKSQALQHDRRSVLIRADPARLVSQCSSVYRRLFSPCDGFPIRSLLSPHCHFSLRPTNLNRLF